MSRVPVTMPCQGHRKMTLLALLEGECVEIEHEDQSEKWLGGNHYFIVGDEERGTFDEASFDEIIEVTT